MSDETDRSEAEWLRRVVAGDRGDALVALTAPTLRASTGSGCARSTTPATAPEVVAAASEEARGVTPDGEDTVERIADEFLVREAVETLSPKHREVITMSFDEDLADGQIADRLDVPVGTVRSRTYYALHALRLELEERGLLA